MNASTNTMTVASAASNVGHVCLAGREQLGAAAGGRLLGRLHLEGLFPGDDRLAGAEADPEADQSRRGQTGGRELGDDEGRGREGGEPHRLPELDVLT